MFHFDGQTDTEAETYYALQSFLHSEKILKEVEISLGKGADRYGPGSGGALCRWSKGR